MVMQKNKIYYLLIFVFLCSFLSSCKKGDDDPAISFRSRNNRIEGKWKVSSINYSHHYQGYYGNENTTITYNGTTLLYQITENGDTDKEEYFNYLFTLEILKKGKLTYTESYNYLNENNNITINGIWYWLNNKKDFVYFPFNIIDMYCNTWQIKELRNKKIVLYFSGSMNEQQNTTTEEASITATIELESIK